MEMMIPQQCRKEVTREHPGRGHAPTYSYSPIYIRFVLLSRRGRYKDDAKTPFVKTLSVGVCVEGGGGEEGGGYHLQHKALPQYFYPSCSSLSVMSAIPAR